MHVTARAVPGLRSFRDQAVTCLVLLLMRSLNDGQFQIVHFSVQVNHVHFIVEADDGETVTKKMTGFMVSFARRFNLLCGRRGKVWRDRFYARDITTASEMHHVLAYVFGNAKKHGVIPRDADWLDPASSAWTFDGWQEPVVLPPEELRWQAPTPRTELLKRDWIAHGLLRV
jgi:REP element-mobilizing transposase RayT